MSQYKVIKDSPVFAYVNGELMHDFPKRIIKRGERVDGERVMLLLTDPEKGSENLPFLRIKDDKYIKLKNLKQMSHSNNSDNSNFIASTRRSKSQRRQKGLVNTARQTVSPCTQPCTELEFYLGLCPYPDLKCRKLGVVASPTQSNATGAIVKSLNNKRYVINGSVGAVTGFAISHFFMKGENMILSTAIGIAAGMGLAFWSNKNEEKNAAKLAANPPASAPEKTNEDDDEASNAAGKNLGKYSPYKTAKYSPYKSVTSDFNIVQNGLMGADESLRKIA